MTVWECQLVNLCGKPQTSIHLHSRWARFLSLCSRSGTGSTTRLRTCLRCAYPLFQVPTLYLFVALGWSSWTYFTIVSVASIGWVCTAPVKEFMDGGEEEIWHP